MMKFNKEYTLGALLILIIIMVLKPNILGFLYNNVLGKLIFVAAIVFISLKHTAAGLLAVVFVSLVASMSGHTGFEGMTSDDKKEDESDDCGKDNGPCKEGKCKDGKACPSSEDSKDAATPSSDATAAIEKAMAKASS